MKKLVMSIAACVLLVPGFPAAATFSGEVMDSQCAKGGGSRVDVQEDGHQ
jgi:hypothetical protein